MNSADAGSHDHTKTLLRPHGKLKSPGDELERAGPNGWNSHRQKNENESLPDALEVPDVSNEGHGSLKVDTGPVNMSEVSVENLVSKRRLDQASSGISDVSSGSMRLNSAWFVRKVMHEVIFTPLGILLFYRLCPSGIMVLSVMVIFCPGSDHSRSFCGDPGFHGIYDTDSVFSVVSLIFLGVSLLFTLCMCSLFWIHMIEVVGKFRISLRVTRMLNTVLATVQPEEKEDVQPIPITRRLAVFLYVVFALLFLLISELTLLFLYPFRLAPGLFFGDYEIFRSVVFGSVMAVVNAVAGSLAIKENSVSPVGLILVGIAGASLLANLMFLFVYAVDDRSNIFSAFVVNCSISPPAPRTFSEDSDDEADFPFYRTLRYRKEVKVEKERKIKRFEILQLMKNLRTNSSLQKVTFSKENDLPAECGLLLAQFLKTHPLTALLNVNGLDLNEIPTSLSLILSPDTLRVKALFGPDEHGLVPWDTRRVRWQDGLPWSGLARTEDCSSKSSPEQLFPFLIGFVLGLVDTGKLKELDLSSNELTDDVSKDIAEFLLRAEKLETIELGSNNFTLGEYRRIIGSVIRNRKIIFVRLSSVLIDIENIRTSRCLDLSLPTMYARAVAKCVDSLFDACAPEPTLTGSFATQPTKLSKQEERAYFERLSTVIANEFGSVGREYYRSVTPSVAQLCIARTAHRLGKHVLADPGNQLDLKPEQCIDGSIAKETDIVETKLYMSFLSDADFVLISSIIDIQNDSIAELDLRGMPLTGNQISMILRCLISKSALKSLNFGFCGVKDPLALPELMKFLKTCSETLSEINLKGNPAFAGKKDHIWSLLDSYPRAFNPRIIVDNYW